MKTDSENSGNGMETLHKLNPDYRKGCPVWMKKKRRRRIFKGITNQAPAEPKLKFKE